MGVIGLGGSGCLEELPCEGNQARATAVGLEAEMADADEATGNDMEEESLDEGSRFEGERLAGVAAFAIAIAKGHQAVLEGEQALVSHGDAVGVAAEIPEDLGGTRQGGFAVDHPLLGRCLAKKAAAERSPQGGGA
jgi:hypothetical protein